MKKEKAVKNVRKARKLYKVSKKLVKNRKRLGKAFYSLMYLFVHWDRSEQKIYTGKRK